MADTPAERKRRSRAHLRGDHSLCSAERRCEAVEAVLRAEIAEEPLPERGPRAQALFDEMSELALGPMERVLLEEACRCVDRLDLLRNAVEVAAMTEARHQATALRGLLAEIRRAAGAPAGKPTTTKPAAKTPDEPSEGAVRDDFASRLAARRAAAAG